MTVGTPEGSAAPLAHVACIPPYPPGRLIEAVAREYQLDPASIVKLASNENPRGCSVAAQRALRAAAQTQNLYPDFDSIELRNSIARMEGLAPNQVLPVAGSSEAILLAARAWLDPTRAALIPRYSFQSYEGAVRSVGSKVIFTPVVDWAPDLNALRTAVTPATRLAYVASPNNPTGTRLPARAIERFAAALPRHVMLVLDFAYREYLEPPQQPEIPRLLAIRRELLILGTFSKIHGLAGLRVGFAFGNAEVIGILRRLQLPFSVSSMAQRAATAALADVDFVQESRRLNAAERTRMGAALRQRGIEFVPSAANFILVRVGDGVALADQLMRRGVIARPVDNYGLPEWIRISIGLPQENDRLLAALAQADIRFDARGRG
jgi:histidinol-phosphate aminotransferase